tara:strand:- start:225 stop:1211 length:987 start_codon:yes stop_codon:yes gene_type:complete
MNKKILITGANGFLGSAITRLALKKKFKVNVLVRKNTNLQNLEKLKSKINLFYGDLRDVNSLDTPISNSDIIFHVAADYRLWSRNPKEIYDSNVRGTENVCIKTTEYNKQLIYTSSVATLGINKNNLSDEETPVSFLEMVGDYKKSKYLAEKIVKNFIKKKRMLGIIVNPSTPIGPGDIKPTPTGKIIYDVLNGRMPAYVDTGLNIVHVDDVAEGHFLALKYGKVGDRYILGGENLEFKDFIDHISYFGQKPKVEIKLNPKYLIPIAYINEFLFRFFINKEPSLTLDGLKMSTKKMFFSSEKAKKKLRYRPRTVKNAIKDSVDWFDNF